MNNDLTKSLEKYLLAIDELKEDGYFDIKVKDVAMRLNVGGSSAADAIKALKEKGYLDYEPYKNINLTTKGLEKISIKKYRQKTIRKFLSNVLEIENSMAQTSSQNIEFSMPEIVLERFIHFLNFMEQCSCKEPKWIKSCKKVLHGGIMPEKCTNCINNSEKKCCCNGCDE